MSAKYNNNGTHNIYVLSADGKTSRLLSDMPIKTDNERKVVERVLNVYGKKAGVTDGVGLKYSKSEGSGKTLAFTTGKKVYVNTEGGVSSLLSNYHNLKSVMYHEKLHQDDQKSGKFFKDIDFEGLMNHSDIYLKQMQDDSFISTSQDFKGGQINAFRGYLEKTLNKSSSTFDEKESVQNVMNLVHSFNETSGKKYGYSISVKAVPIDGEITYTVDLHKIQNQKEK
jgi:hypothetical protein